MAKVRVKLNDVFVEGKGKEWAAQFSRTEGKRWYAMVALKMTDLESRAPIAEWFYLVACSKGYTEKPLKIGPEPDPIYTVVQEALDIAALKHIAEDRLRRVHADNWTDFYRNMEQYFMYDD